MLVNCGLNINTEEIHKSKYIPEFFSKKYTSNKSFNFNVNPNEMISNKISKKEKALIGSGMGDHSPPATKLNRKFDKLNYANNNFRMFNKNGIERNNKLKNNENYSSMFKFLYLL